MPFWQIIAEKVLHRKWWNSDAVLVAHCKRSQILVVYSTIWEGTPWSPCEILQSFCLPCCNSKHFPTFPQLSHTELTQGDHKLPSLRSIEYENSPVQAVPIKLNLSGTVLLCLDTYVQLKKNIVKFLCSLHKQLEIERFTTPLNCRQFTTLLKKKKYIYILSHPQHLEALAPGSTPLDLEMAAKSLVHAHAVEGGNKILDAWTGRTPLSFRLSSKTQYSAYASHHTITKLHHTAAHTALAIG